MEYLSLKNILKVFHLPQLCLDVFRQKARIPGCKLRNLQNSRSPTKHTLRHKALYYEHT